MSDQVLPAYDLTLEQLLTGDWLITVIPIDEYMQPMAGGSFRGDTLDSTLAQAKQYIEERQVEQ